LKLVLLWVRVREDALANAFVRVVFGMVVVAVVGVRVVMRVAVVAVQPLVEVAEHAVVVACGVMAGYHPFVL